MIDGKAVCEASDIAPIKMASTGLISGTIKFGKVKAKASGVVIGGKGVGLLTVTQKAVARERIVTEPQSGEFVARYGLRAASSVKTSLQMLLEKQLLYRDDRGYVVYDRLLGEWLRRQ